jgi:hypothetical protein
VLGAAVGASVLISYCAFEVLRRLGGALIRVALYGSFALLVASSVALCFLNIVAGQSNLTRRHAEAQARILLRLTDG